MAMRDIEILVLESITEKCKDPKINLVLMNSVQYSELMSDYMRSQDVIQVLSEALQRPITIKPSKSLSNNEFKWAKDWEQK